MARFGEKCEQKPTCPACNGLLPEEGCAGLFRGAICGRSAINTAGSERTLSWHCHISGDFQRLKQTREMYFGKVYRGLLHSLQLWSKCCVQFVVKRPTPD